MQNINHLHFGIAMLIAYAHAASMSCRSEPESDDENSIDESSTFTLICEITGNDDNNNNNIKSCSWEHYETMNENRGNNYAPDIQCNYAEGSSGNGNCQSDPRITGLATKSSCQITISNSEPEDTGDWNVELYTVSTVEITYFFNLTLHIVIK